MKRFLIFLLILINLQAIGQNYKNRLVAWYIPSINTRINGLAAGFIINSMKDKVPLSTTVVNGLSLELVGVGFFTTCTK